MLLNKVCARRKWWKVAEEVLRGIKSSRVRAEKQELPDISLGNRRMLCVLHWPCIRLAAAMKNHDTQCNILRLFLLTWPMPGSLKDNEIWDKEVFWLISVSSHLTESCSKGHNTDNSLCRKTWTVHLGSSYFSSCWHLHQSIMSSASNALLKLAYPNKNCFFYSKDAVCWFNLISVQIHVQICVHPMCGFGFSFYMTRVWVTSLLHKIMLSDRGGWKNKFSEHLQNNFCNEK